MSRELTADDRAFLAAVEAAPTDEGPRKVYADWLDEHGYPDEAAEMRRWTHAMLEARVRIEVFVENLQDTEDEYYAPPDTYEELMEAADEFVRSGDEYSCWQRTPDIEHEVLQQFWRDYRTIRGLEGDVADAALVAAVAEDTDYEPDEVEEMRARLREAQKEGESFFRCAC